jgi:hypothetical protein
MVTRIAKIVIIALLFIPVTGYSQSMRRDSLRNDVYLLLNTSTGEILTTARVKAIVNMAVIDVCRDFPAYEKFYTIIASSSVEGQSVPSDFMRIKALSRMIVDSMRIPLRYEPDPDKLTDTTAKLDMPDDFVAQSNNLWSPRYYWVMANKVCFFPKYSKPDNDSFLLEYYARWTGDTAESTQIGINYNYRAALLLKACVLCSQTRKNWGDAGEYQKAYDAEIIKKGLPRSEDTGWRSIKVGQ